MNNSTRTVNEVLLKIISIQKLTILLSIAALLFFATGCGRGIFENYSGNGNDPSPPSNDPSPPLTGSVSFSWSAPMTNANGTYLSDLGGYNIYDGMSSRTYSNSVNVGSQTGATISSLSAGIWCFAVTSYDLSGNESDFSNEACTVI